MNENLMKQVGEEYIEFIEKIKKDTYKESIEINLKKEDNISIFSSKIGGYPYLEHGQIVECDAEGIQLFFLGQINCEELPDNNIYPSKGLLQFWIGRDDVYGADFDDLVNGGQHQIQYYENIDKSVRLEEVKEKYLPVIDEVETFSPLNDNVSYKMDFIKINQAATPESSGFEEYFVEKYNEEFPDNEIFDLMDLDNFSEEYIYKELTKDGSRIGGYPYFTQFDPREENDGYNVLLLQIDSIKGGDIMWGDWGVCNFFIKEEDLKAKNFEEVMYNWDCQ